MYFFFTFLLSITLLGSVEVGPLSIRVYSTVAMIAILLYNRMKNKESYVFIEHSMLKIYIIFVIIMGVTQFINGDIYEYQYFKRLLAYHLVCVVTFLSIEYFVNSSKDLKRTIILLSIVLLFNNVITILQFTGNYLGWQIGMLFGDINNFYDVADTHNSLIGYSNTPGIYNHVVLNAFVIAVISPLTLCLVDNSNKIIIRLFGLVSFVIAFLACFMTQQRAAFYLFLLCIVVYIFIEIKKYPIIIFVSSLLLMLFVDNINFGNIDIGRLSNTTDDSRSYLYRNAFAFISDHPLWGGPMLFQKIAGKSSHNVVLDSWICAGFMGFIIMMMLLCKTLCYSVKTFFEGIRIKGQNRYMVFCAIAVINAMVYGFTHNTSYLTGDVIIFIVLALMLKTLKINILSR